MLIRRRGVIVKDLEGQNDSQNPHSMQGSIIELTGGRGLIFFTWESGSSVNITPGFNMLLGSIRYLISRII